MKRHINALKIETKMRKTKDKVKIMENENNKHYWKRLLNVEEAAAYLNLSPRTLYNGIAPKSKNPMPIKVRRIGKLVKFDIRDLESYVDSL